MTSKKKVLKNAVVYTFSNIMIKAFNFFLLPLYTAYLSAADYGTTNLIKNFSGVMSIVCVFSSYAAVARFFADYKDDKDKTRKLFGTLITFTFLSGLCFTLLIVINRAFFIKYIFKGLSFFPTVLMAIIGVMFGCLYNMYQYILKGAEQATKSAITSIIYFFLMLALNIIFVVGLKMGANGVILATLITNILCTSYMLMSLLRHRLIKFGIDLSILKEVLKYSIPLMPHDLSTTISSLFSSVFINNSFNLSSLGLYSMASQFGDITDTVQSSVNTAFQPWFFVQMRDRSSSSNESIRKLSYTLVWLYSAFFLGIALFSQDVILLLLNENYILAWKLIPLIVVSYSIKTIYYFYVNVLFYYKTASKYIFIATLSSSILNVILSAVLIPRYSSYGSIAADIITMIVRVVIIVYISKKFDDIGYKVMSFLKITFVEIVFIFIGLWFSYTKYSEIFDFKNFLFKCVVYLVFLGWVLFSQRQNILNIVSKWKGNKNEK